MKKCKHDWIIQPEGWNPQVKSFVGNLNPETLELNLDQYKVCSKCGNFKRLEGKEI